MRIFVSGATGVIGRRVVPDLLELGHAVTAVTRDAEARGRLERAGAKCVSVELFAPDDVKRAVEGHDVLVNLATHMPSSYFKMLIRGSWRLNDRIRGSARRVCITS